MKRLILLVLLTVSFNVSAATNSPAMAEILSTNRVWTSISANHKPIGANQYFGDSWLVLCKPVHPYLVDYMTVYYNPSIKVTPIPSDRPQDVSAIIEKPGFPPQKISVHRFGTNDYKWIKLEPSALEDAVRRIPNRKYFRE